jgi:choline dehydrogenase
MDDGGGRGVKVFCEFLKTGRMPEVDEQDGQLTEVADFVVVGAGSAGCVVAEGLSANARHSVVVLEAGREDADRRVRVPLAFSQLFCGDFDWNYLTEPQAGLSDRKIYWPRGKVIGGSSSLNAMMWVRGFAADYDEWAQHAGQEWGFSSIVELYRRIERLKDAREVHEGAHGRQYISRQRSPRRFTAAWLQAMQQVGYPIERPNLPNPQGCSATVVTQRRGARWSAADAFLRPALRRRNLRLITSATACRVLFEGKRAVGVEFMHGNSRRVIRARREVVLCAGTVNSAQLLLLSGIGDHSKLHRHGIEPVYHAPEVGENLRDHLLAYLGFAVDGDTLFDAAKRRHALNFRFRRRGMLTSPSGEAYGFTRSDPALALPDIELFFGPGPFFDEGLVPPQGHAVVLGSILLKPASLGRISLRSSDPAAKPIIDPRYLSDCEGLDRAAMMQGLRVCAKIAQASPLKELLGPIARPRGATDFSDETLAAAIRNDSYTIYHPVGTCRMGSDATSVVTPRLVVRGVHGLRVADASVMPTAIRGHTHAPSMVIGAKAVELIAGSAT